jgi:hypothetical protein
MEEKKPVCKLVGTDGNVFALAGRVTDALKKVKQYDKASEFSKKLFECKDYNAALRLMMEYVKVK